MAQLITDVRDPRRQAHVQELQMIQHQLDAIKFQYADSTLAFKTLDLAWEAVRMAWYAVRQETREHLDNCESSLNWVKGHADHHNDNPLPHQRSHDVQV